jgi:hypothetical protein
MDTPTADRTALKTGASQGWRLTGHHHAQSLSRRLIGTLVTVLLVPFAASRVIGKTVQRAQADRFHREVGAWSRSRRETWRSWPIAKWMQAMVCAQLLTRRSCNIRAISTGEGCPAVNCGQ